MIVDTLTNNIRGTKSRAADSPEKLVARLATVRETLYATGAATVVICQVKPMKNVDVSPYNRLLHDFLCFQPDGGPECETQIQMADIKPGSDESGNGFHIQPECVAILDRTYACAIRNVPVPCPTPFDEFVPLHVRQRWETEWPKLRRVGGRFPMNHYGR